MTRIDHGVRSQMRWSRLISGVCLTAGVAMIWVGAPSGVVHAESAGCASLNDPANGYNGQNSGNSVTGLEFGLNDRIYITADTPASGGVKGFTVTIDGFTREVPGLPTQGRYPGLVEWVEKAGAIDMEWAVLLDDEVPATGEETLTWTVNCDPGPEVLEARTICRDGAGLVVLDIEDSDLASYNVFVSAVPWPGDVQDQFEVVVTAAGLNSFEFGPYPNGMFEVVVEPLDNLGLEFLWGEPVSVECLPGETPPPPSETPTTQAAAPAGAGLARDDVSVDNATMSVVRVDHLANDDESLLGETFDLVHPEHGDGYIDMRIDGEGWWWALQDGRGSYWIEFEPDPALTRDPTPQRYSIRDADGVVHYALVTITFAWPTTSATAPTGPATTIEPTDTLPATGSSSPGVPVAVATLAAGLILVAASRRRLT